MCGVDRNSYFSWFSVLEKSLIKYTNMPKTQDSILDRYVTTFKWTMLFTSYSQCSTTLSNSQAPRIHKFQQSLYNIRKSNGWIGTQYRNQKKVYCVYDNSFISCRKSWKWSIETPTFKILENKSLYKLFCNFNFFRIRCSILWVNLGCQFQTLKRQKKYSQIRTSSIFNHTIISYFHNVRYRPSTWPTVIRHIYVFVSFHKSTFGWIPKVETQSLVSSNKCGGKKSDKS